MPGPFLLGGRAPGIRLKAITDEKEREMRGMGHRYCENCGHAVRAGRNGCGSCGSAIAGMMMLDVAFDSGFANDGIGFDPMDGQMAVDLGDGLAIEPGTGQVDMDFGGIDIPL